MAFQKRIFVSKFDQLQIQVKIVPSFRSLLKKNWKKTIC